MGTTCYAAHNSPRTYEEEKREIESIYANAGKNEILQAAKVGNMFVCASPLKKPTKCGMKSMIGVSSNQIIGSN